MVGVNLPSAPTSLIYRLPGILDRLDWPTVFGSALPERVELELGSGDGSFLAQWASQHPEIAFIGVERLLGRLRKLDRKGRRLGLNNLRVLRIEAAYCLQYLIPQKTLEAIHVYFPDPWPKRKHRDRRLINPAFTEQAAIALKPGGTVWLRTDNADYFSQMVEVFGNSPRFESIETPEALALVTTDFERYFNAQGIPTLRAGYRLKN